MLKNKLKRILICIHMVCVCHAKIDSETKLLSTRQHNWCCWMTRRLERENLWPNLGRLILWRQPLQTGEIWALVTLNVWPANDNNHKNGWKILEWNDVQVHPFNVQDISTDTLSSAISWWIFVECAPIFYCEMQSITFDYLNIIDNFIGKLSRTKTTF